MLMFTVLIKAGTPTGVRWEKHSPAPTNHPEVRRLSGMFLILTVGARQPPISPESAVQACALGCFPLRQAPNRPMLGALDPGLAPGA